MIRISNDAPPCVPVIFTGAVLGWIASFGPGLPAYGAWITIPLGIAMFLGLAVWVWKEEWPVEAPPEQPLRIPRSSNLEALDAAVAQAIRDGRFTQSQIDVVRRWARKDVMR